MVATGVAILGLILLIGLLFLLYQLWQELVPFIYMGRFIPISAISSWKILAFDTKRGTCRAVSMDIGSISSLRPLTVVRSRKIVSQGDPVQIYFLKECLKAHWPDVYEEIFNVHI